MAQKDGVATNMNVVEAPSTHGRPVFSVGSRKNFPSKWDDAEKWLINGRRSPAHAFIKSADFGGKTHEKEERVTRATCIFQGPKIGSLGHHLRNSDTSFNGVSALETSDLLLKDKFTDEVEPVFPEFKCLESMNQGFVFRNSKEVLQGVKIKDTGTEMTPIGSSTTSRCPTPLKTLSPPRHNTPLGALGLNGQSSSLDISELHECHLAKLQPRTLFDAITSNWSSREEEEEDISKSLRHFQMNDEWVESISGPRPSAWEEKEKSEPCLRYQIAEAKIQAWVNLQKAKVEAESRKLEVKIEKMRSKYEDKMMKKMRVVDRKAAELRAAAQVEHSEQTSTTSNKTMNRHHQSDAPFSNHHDSCGCFLRN